MRLGIRTLMLMIACQVLVGLGNVTMLSAQDRPAVATAPRDPNALTLDATMAQALLPAGPATVQERATRTLRSIDMAIRKELKKLQSEKNETARQDIEQAIHDNVAKLFEARQALRVAELDAMEKELARLREMHARREADKDRIIADRTKQLILETEGLGWGSSPGISSRDVFPARAFGPEGAFPMEEFPLANPFGVDAMDDDPFAESPLEATATTTIAPAAPAAPVPPPSPEKVDVVRRPRPAVAPARPKQ